jgi:hypothetical protein
MVGTPGGISGSFGPNWSKKLSRLSAIQCGRSTFPRRRHGLAGDAVEFEPVSTFKCTYQGQIQGILREKGSEGEVRPPIYR